MKWEKQSTEASQPILHRNKDSRIQSTYHGLGRHGTHCNKDSKTQEVRSPPAFLWFILKNYNTTFNTLIHELMVGEVIRKNRMYLKWILS